MSAGSPSSFLSGNIPSPFFTFITKSRKKIERKSSGASPRVATGLQLQCCKNGLYELAELERRDSTPIAAQRNFTSHKSNNLEKRPLLLQEIKPGSCHKRQKPQAPTPQAPIRNRQTRKVANVKGLNRNTNLTSPNLT